MAVSSGTFDLSSLGTTAGQRFTLALTTLTGGNLPGPLDSGYVPGAPYEFSIATTMGGLAVPVGFFTAAGSDLTPLFDISLVGWQGTAPALADVAVRVNATGSGLSLVIVPEPTMALSGAMSAGLAAILLFRRRHREDR